MKLIPAFLLMAGTLPALPLQQGEQLSYRVSWAVVPGAGEIRISAGQDAALAPTGRPLHWSRALCAGAMLALAVAALARSSPFLYFQF